MRSTKRALFWRHAPRVGLGLGILAVLITAFLAYSWAKPRPDSLRDLELITRVAAFSAGTSFILYRIFSGFFVTNLELTLVLRRVRITGAQRDHLLLDVAASKGAHGTLALRHARARVLQQQAKSWEQIGSKPLEGIERVRTDKLTEDIWEKNAGRPDLPLAPGDRMEYAAYFDVEHDAVCKVEVVIAGKTLVYLRSGQWRATCFSVPEAQLPSRATAPPNH